MMLDIRQLPLHLGEEEIFQIIRQREKESKGLQQKPSQTSLKSVAGSSRLTRQKNQNSTNKLEDIFRDEIQREDQNLKRSEKEFLKKALDEADARDWDQRHGSGSWLSRKVSDTSLRHSSSNAHILSNNRSQNISLEDNIAKMYIDPKGKSKLDPQLADPRETQSTQPEDLYDFHLQVEKLKQRALEEGDQNRFDYFANLDHGKSVRASSKMQRSQRKLSPFCQNLSPSKQTRIIQENINNHLPTNLEQRMALDRKKSMTSRYTGKENSPSHSRDRVCSKFVKRCLQGGVSPEFKRHEKPDVKVKVGLDMLHTDELLGYYKEVLSKSKRDLISHQRQQNYIKKLQKI